jgi:hypothetical protein
VGRLEEYVNIKKVDGNKNLPIRLYLIGRLFLILGSTDLVLANEKKAIR